MKIKYEFNNYNYGVSDFKLPENCPFCGKRVAFIPKYLGYNDSREELILLVGCPDCGKISLYTYNHGNSNLPFDIISLCLDSTKTFGGTYLYPKLVYKQPDFSIKDDFHDDFKNYLNEKYERFYAIYKEAVLIYQLGFQESAMMIYRRSLEILVKTYLEQELGISHNEVVSMSLFEAIKLINDKNIESLMNGVRIIGNDFTHYDSSYDEKEQNNLIYFMKVILQYFELKMAAENAKEFIK